jgi:hypothetical protein
VRPDWARVSFPGANITRELDKLGPALFIYLVRQGVFVGQSSGWTCSRLEKGQNGFEHAVYIRFQDQIRASIQWGGMSQRDKVLMEIRGGLCALLQRKQWLFLDRAIGRYGGRPSQIDIAADDLQGKYFSPDLTREKFRADPGAFLPGHRHRRGSHQLAEEWHESATGKTLYLGSRGSSTRTRIYEKGRQLHDTEKGMDNPLWCRWEVTLRRANGVELHRHIFHPDYWLDFLLGSCHDLALLWNREGLRATHVLDEPKSEVQEQAGKVAYTLFMQYGGSIYHLIQLFGLEGFHSLCARPNPDSGIAGLTRDDAEEVLHHYHRLLYPNLTRADAEEMTEKFKQLRSWAETKSGQGAAAGRLDTVEW